MADTIRQRGWGRAWLAAVALAGTAATVPQAAQAESLMDALFGPEIVTSAPPARSATAERGGKSPLVSYNTPSRSWAYLPATVYASVQTLDGRYPVYPQNVVAGMPVQTAPRMPVVMQTRPVGVYGGMGE
ncbi:MAG: hypothetical protein HQL80_05955 [Magnetococcales bacterium]|nr:hypothetical protein [Magnetococcales bacterium]